MWFDRDVEKCTVTLGNSSKIKDSVNGTPLTLLCGWLVCSGYPQSELWAKNAWEAHKFSDHTIGKGTGYSSDPRVLQDSTGVGPFPPLGSWDMMCASRLRVVQHVRAGKSDSTKAEPQAGLCVSFREQFWQRRSFMSRSHSLNNIWASWSPIYSPSHKAKSSYLTDTLPT